MRPFPFLFFEERQLSIVLERGRCNGKAKKPNAAPRNLHAGKKPAGILRYVR